MEKHISHIPHEPGVYLFKSKGGKILYIGKAKDLHKRVQQYFTPGSVWKQDMVAKADNVDFITVENEGESLYLEDNLIKKHKPPYNSLLKGDNTYIFLKITNEPFSQVLRVRKRKNDGSLYIGPKRSTRTLKTVLHYLRMYIKFRGCKSTQFKQGKLCSDYFRGMCQGRCIFAQLKSSSSNSKLLISQAKKLGLTIDKTYEEYVDEYQSMMNIIAKTIDSNPKDIISQVYEKIQYCIDTQNFERAKQLKEVYIGLQGYYEVQKVVLHEQLNGDIVKLTKIGSYYVYILIQLRSGRIIDIIRHKLSIHDTDIHELLVLRESERNSSLVIKYHTETGRNKVNITDYHRKDEIEKLEKIVVRGFFLYAQSMKYVHRSLGDIDQMCQNALDSYIISSSFDSENIMNELLLGLQTKYYLKQYPYRIECIDISHFGGKQTSGGLSCLQGGLPHKYGYRKYKIQSTNSGDDYEALREVIIRRFKLKDENISGETKDQLPNLFILDGGKAQLKIVSQLHKDFPHFSHITQYTQFASLEKGVARSRSKRTNNAGGIAEVFHILLDDATIISKKLTYDKIDQLLVNLRDEAHRFANQYRKKQASRERK